MTRHPGRRGCGAGDRLAGAPNTAWVRCRIDFQRLFESLPGAHVVVSADPDPIVVAASKAFLRATTARCDDVVGRRLFEVLPDGPEADGTRGLRASLERVLASAAADRMPVRRYDVPGPDGTSEARWWQPLNTPLRGPSGRVTHVLHTLEDVTAAVTERERAAEALARSEARARVVLEGMGEGFVYLDRDFRIAEINAGGLRMDGRPREAIVGRHLLEVWPEAERLPTWPAYRRAMAERVPVALEYRHVSDVHDVWLDVRAYPVADGGLAVFYRGVTGRKRDEERLRDLVGTLDLAAIMVRDLDGTVVFWSRGCERLYGWTAGEAVGQVSHTLLRTEFPVPPAEIEAALVRDGEWRGDLRHQRRGGGRLVVAAHKVLRRDPAGRPAAVMESLADVTALREARAELRRLNETLEARVAERTAELSRALAQLHAETGEREQAEAALRQAQKMEAVGQLTGGIAHDFNNMLQGIAGGLELIRRRIAQGRVAEVGRFAEVAHQSVERAAALTHRLLAFARRQALQPRVVEADALVEGVAELVRRTAGPGIEVELRLGDSAWPVLCDPNQLESALLNLAINARDAMPEGGRLAIGTRLVRLSAADLADQEGAAPGDYVEVAVSDTGIGMDEATRARVFEPFFTTKPIGQGTGLGLSQVYGFARQSGGLVRLDSAPGRGTTVRLYLPRSAAASASEGEAVRLDRICGGPTPPAPAGRGVLLVEDEAGVREALAERLHELGFAVLEAADGPAALRLLRAGAPVHALVTDVGLPGGINGRQVAEAAREHRPGLPVLFITGYAGGALHKRLAPGMEVISKPFSLDALAERVRALLEPAAVAKRGRVAGNRSRTQPGSRVPGASPGRAQRPT